MTGLIDSDVKPVDSVSKEEGLNLFEPLTKVEYLRKNRYRAKSKLIVRNFAVFLLRNEDRINWIIQKCKDKLGKFLQNKIIIFLTIIAIVLLAVMFWMDVFVFLVDIIDYAQTEWNDREKAEKTLIKWIVAALSLIVAAPSMGIKVLEWMPDGATRRNLNFHENCREIMLNEENPKKMNEWLFYVNWQHLRTDDKKNDTREQTHIAIVENSIEFGIEGSPWRDMREKSLDFLLKWMEGDLRERIPVVLWCFNPPKRDMFWGDLREQHIRTSETLFASEIYSLLDELSNSAGAIYDEFIQQAEENEKSFEWLKEQMFSTARHEPPCVQLLNLWSQHHYSKD